MNLILSIHVDPPNGETDALSPIVGRFSHCRDSEKKTLIQALPAAHRRKAVCDVEALAGSQAEPSCTGYDTRRFLQNAYATLRMVVHVIIPDGHEIVSFGNEHFDVHPNWVVAPLQDILATLGWALG